MHARRVAAVGLALGCALFVLPAQAQVDPTLLLPEEPAPVTTRLDQDLEALVRRLESAPAASADAAALEALTEAARSLYRAALQPGTDPCAGAAPPPFPPAICRGQVLARAGRIDDALAELAAAGSEPAALWLAAFHAVLRTVAAHDFDADDSARAAAIDAIDRGLRVVTAHTSDHVSPWLNAFSALRVLVLQSGSFQGNLLPAPALRWEWDAVLLAAAARAGRRDIAIPLGRRLAVVYPESTLVRCLLARALLADGQHAQARKWFADAAERDRLGWRARVWWGNAALAAGDAAGALDLFGPLVHDCPDRAETWAARAAVHRALRRWDAAAADLERALALAPSHADLLLQLGIARYHLERFELALDALTRAAELDPAQADTHQFLGLALRRLDRRPAALGHLDRAVRLRPDAPDAWAYRGITRHENGDFAGAVEDYGRAFSLGFDSPIFLAKRGEAYASLKRYDLARKDLKDFLARYPDHELAAPVREMLDQLPEK